MSRNYKILLYLALGLLLLLAVYLVFRGLSDKGGSQPASQSQPQAASTTTSSLPDYLLDPEQEKSAYAFVKSFAELYNTYSYGDFSNLSALGDYQTTQMQQRTEEYIKTLGKITPVGYYQETSLLENSLKYKYNQVGRVTITAGLQIKIYNNYAPGLSGTQRPDKIRTSNLTMELVAYKQSWLADNIEIK